MITILSDKLTIHNEIELGTIGNENFTNSFNFSREKDSSLKCIYIFPHIIRGIDEVLEKEEYSILLKSTHNYRKVEAKCLEELVKKNIDEVETHKNFWGKPQTYEELGFKNRTDMLKQIKNDVEQAYWALTELCYWGMDEDYCSKLFVADDDEDGFHTIFTIDGRYFRYANDNIIEVMPKIKLVEVKVWEDKDVKEELPF